MDGLRQRRRSQTYFDSNLDDLPLTTEAFRVYCHLIRRAGADEVAFPSYKSIGLICFAGSYPHSSQATLKGKAIAAVKELVSWNLIEKTLRYREGTNENTSNIYTITDLSEWRSQPKEESDLLHKKRSFRGNQNSSPATNEDVESILSACDRQSPTTTTGSPGLPPRQSPTTTPVVQDYPNKELNIKEIQLSPSPLKSDRARENPATTKPEEEEEEGANAVEANQDRNSPLHTNQWEFKKEETPPNAAPPPSFEKAEQANKGETIAATLARITGTTKYDRWADMAHPALVYQAEDTPWLLPPSAVQFVCFQKEFLTWGGDLYVAKFGKKDVFQARGDFMASLKNDPDKIVARWEEYRQSIKPVERSLPPIDFESMGTRPVVKKVNLPPRKNRISGGMTYAFGAN
jgi:hypothetical protein